MKGAIWDFSPSSLAFNAPFDSVVRYEIVPCEPDPGLVSIQWFIDGVFCEQDTTALELAFAAGEERTESVSVIVADSVVTDTLEWRVFVHAPNDAGKSIVAEDFDLLEVSPNPFNALLTIRYASFSQVGQFGIYDLHGRMVVDLLDRMNRDVRMDKTNDRLYGIVQKGVLTWNCNDIAAGVYLLRMQAGNEITTRKVVLIR